MRSIANFMRAIANLAGSINGLTNLIDAATGRLRQQLALDEASATVLEHHAEESTDAYASVGGVKGTAKRKAKAGV